MATIIKVDDKFQVFGFASAAEITDSQGDTIDADTLERAAYSFVLSDGTGGEMHRRWNVARLIESFFVTKEKANLLGVAEEHIGKWWVGFKVTDAEVWQRVKNGDYKMFSIGGVASNE